MKGKIVWIILSCMMALSLVVAFCAKEVEAEEEGPLVAEANWWDKFGEPEYGGTITYQVPSLSTDFNQYLTMANGLFTYYCEQLFQRDWALDREIWPFDTRFVPDKYWVGCLAESWEIPDAQTIIVHIRQDVNWQDKPPVNGREFTAYDVEHHLHWMAALGNGYTNPSPYYTSQSSTWETVTATDKYTVVFKFKHPTAHAFYSLTTEDGLSHISAPEWVALGGPPSSGPPPVPPKGDSSKGGPPKGGPPKGGPTLLGSGPLQDWHNAVGTGAWMLTDYVSASSAFFTRNPNYWGYDERHPQNQLPYADKVKVLCIPDIATALAALRTGKIDIMTEVAWEQATSLAHTNPELQQSTQPRAGQGIQLRVDKVPFTDINVRKALQMAIDIKTIAESHFGGTVNGIPCGLVSPTYKEYDFPYDEWPQELKDEYSYNPTQAKQLLAEAGYPQGFKTNLVAGSTGDVELMQIVKAYFLDIGVDMEIKLMDPAAAGAITRARKHDQMSWSAMGTAGAIIPPRMAINLRYSTYMANFGCVNDPAYDAIVDKFLASADLEEARLLQVEAVKYALEKHWDINIFPTNVYSVWQPYLKGYTSEYTDTQCQSAGWLWARLWIDQDLKDSMGR